MRTMLMLAALAAPLFAGALRIEVSDAAANAEAQRNHAILVARITACNSPEKVILTATAEGIVDGARKSVPLKVIYLAQAGFFGVAPESLGQGKWAIKLVATNPEIKDYSTGVVVPVDKNVLRWAALEHYYHQPTEQEVATVLGKGIVDRASIH